QPTTRSVLARTLNTIRMLIPPGLLVHRVEGKASKGSTLSKKVKSPAPQDRRLRDCWAPRTFSPPSPSGRETSRGRQRPGLYRLEIGDVDRGEIDPLQPGAAV